MASKFKKGDKVVLNSHYPGNSVHPILSEDEVYEVLKMRKLQLTPGWHVTVFVPQLDDAGEGAELEFSTRRFKMAPSPLKFADLLEGEEFNWLDENGERRHSHPCTKVTVLLGTRSFSGWCIDYPPEPEMANHVWRTSPEEEDFAVERI